MSHGDLGIVEKHRKKKPIKIGRVQLQRVQNKTKQVSFRLYAFSRDKSNKPHKNIHILNKYCGCTQTINKYIYIESKISEKNLIAVGRNM